MWLNGKLSRWIQTAFSCNIEYDRAKQGILPSLPVSSCPKWWKLLTSKILVITFIHFVDKPSGGGKQYWTVWNSEIFFNFNDKDIQLTMTIYITALSMYVLRLLVSRGFNIIPLLHSLFTTRSTERRRRRRWWRIREWWGTWWRWLWGQNHRLHQWSEDKKGEMMNCEARQASLIY